MQFRKAISPLVLMFSFALTACEPPTAPTQPPSQPPVQSSTPSVPGQNANLNTQSCPANELQYLVGQPRTVLQTMRFGGVVRFEEPGQMVTQDYSAARTRIIIGANGKIERIICG